jgi:hypothetical protein
MIWKLPGSADFTAVIVIGAEKDGMVQVLARSAHRGFVEFTAAVCDLEENPKQ